MNALTRTLLACFAWTLASCGPPSQADLDSTRGGRVDIYFNEPGTRSTNLWEPDIIDVMIDAIDDARVSIDMAVMGFGRKELIDSLIRAYDRGVQLRMVGDAGHLYNSGYKRFQDRHIPLVVGNMNHIMHHKFMVIDDRFVFAGTANWTDTDLRHNSNNFLMLDSPPVAADFTAEFEQMFAGAFGHTKVELNNGRTYTVGDTEVEVWFSPNEDAMGRMLEYIEEVEDSLRFTIFAFTKDQVGSALLRKQAEFAAKDEAEGISPDADFRTRRSVAGIIDQSQLHSNGQYHEVFRLLGGQIPLRMDGNDNSKHPGDYQAGGGRLHSKTMILDAYGENPVVITGSFNWSASATTSNDEYLLILKGPRVAKMYDEYFENLWEDARPMGVDAVRNGVRPGDVVINEVMWFGEHPGDPEGNDEYIELRNTTDRELHLDLWQIAKRDDFVVGFPPGSVVPPGGTYTILDHTLEPYEDGVPQNEFSAYSRGDLVVNSFNDNRQARLYLKDGSMDLRLLDPDGKAIDVAGDGGPPFFGGPDNGRVFSMERREDPGDGRDPASWYTCSANEGGYYVRDRYKSILIGTPGEPNSPE